MTTALKVTDSTTTFENRKEFRCPVTASEAYNLGMAMEKMLSNIYIELGTRCQSLAAKKTLRSFAQQSKEDVANFFAGFKYTLNCEIACFYQERGVVFPSDITETEMTATQPLITRNLDNFFHKIDGLQKDLKSQTDNELGEYFNTKSSQDVYELGIQVRTNSSELYERLAKLYPEGEIRKAFEEMAQVISAGTGKLSS